MTQLPDTKPGPYYISIIRDSSQQALLSGPYDKHADALALVDTAKDIAEKLDSRAFWDSFGTVRMSPEYSKPGRLQAFGYDIQLNKVAAHE